MQLIIIVSDKKITLVLPSCHKIIATATTIIPMALALQMGKGGE